MEVIACTCCSGKSYIECCQPFHLKTATAPSPEHLMRSRYCAYALHLTDYLSETTHPTKRHLYSKADIEQWAKANHWLKLEIIDAKENIVEFKAFYLNKLKQYVHHEKSLFKKDGDKWYYFSGEHF